MTVVPTFFKGREDWQNEVDSTVNNSSIHTPQEKSAAQMIFTVCLVYLTVHFLIASGTYANHRT